MDDLSGLGEPALGHRNRRVELADVPLLPTTLRPTAGSGSTAQVDADNDDDDRDNEGQFQG